MTNLDTAKDLAWKLLDGIGWSSAAEHDDYFADPEGWGAAWDISVRRTFPGSLDSPPEHHTHGWVRLTDPDGVAYTFTVDGPDGGIDMTLEDQ
jgi:hypothetical protein